MFTNFELFSTNLSYALAWMVVHSLWQATLIALITGLVLIALNKKSAQLRYIIANISLFSILLSAIITFSIYYQSSFTPGENQFTPFQEIKTAEPLTLTTTTLANEQQSIAVDNRVKFSLSGFIDFCNRNIYFIVLFWFLGVVVFLLKILSNILYIYYLRNRVNFPADEYWIKLLEGLKLKTKISKFIELVESPLVRSPMVVGLIKPMILFPIGVINRLEPEQVEAILAHELAHIIRKDYLFNILQAIIESIFYYHPGVWWVSAQIRTERENCCDDIAVELCGNSITYAKSLVAIQEMAYFNPSYAMSFAGNTKNQLLTRIQRLISNQSTKSNVMEKFISTIVVLFLLIFLNIANAHQPNFKASDINEKLPSIDSVYKVQFLKYRNTFGLLDSFPVAADIKDGKYNYTESMYAVELTVKNQYVIDFNINGLHVDPKDFVKFSEMINTILSPKTKQKINSNTSLANRSDLLRSNKIEIPESTSDDATFEIPSVASIESAENSKADYENNKALMREQKEQLREQLSCLGRQLSDLKNLDIPNKILGDLDTELQNLKVRMKSVNTQKIVDDIQEAIDDMQEDINDKRDELEEAESIQMEKDDALNEFLDAVENELKLDKFLSEEKSVQFELRKGELLINGAEQSKSLFSKYNSIYESFNDEPLEKDQKIIHYFYNLAKANNNINYNGFGFGYSTSPNSSSWKKEEGTKDKKEGKSFIPYYINLLKENDLVELNKKLRIESSNTELRINGKVIDQKLHNRIIKEALELSGKNKLPNFKFKLSMNGVIDDVSNKKINFTGRYSDQQSND